MVPFWCAPGRPGGGAGHEQAAWQQAFVTRLSMHRAPGLLLHQVLESGNEPLVALVVVALAVEAEAVLRLGQIP